MRFTVPLMAIALGTALGAPAQVLDRYTGAVTVDPGRKGYHAELVIAFDSLPATDSIKFYLHGGAQVAAVGADGEAIDYVLTDEASYGNQQALVIPIVNIPGDHIEVDYSLDFAAIEQRFAYDPDWFEFNLYTTWFPWNIDYGLFDYRVAVHTADPVIAPGAEAMSGGFVIESPVRSFDIPFVVSRAAESYGDPGSSIAVYAHEVPDTTAALIGDKAEAYFALFDSTFGAPESADLTIAVSSTGRQLSYARPQFISLEVDSVLTKVNDKTLAHEIAHLWWNKASLGSWDDWLNEAFAEYSSLIVYRRTYGQPALDAWLEKIDAWLGESELPPLWGLDKSDPSSNQVYTYVGAQHLLELEREIGEEQMLGLLRDVHTGGVKTTPDFLDAVQESSGAEVRSWLEARLRS